MNLPRVRLSSRRDITSSVKSLSRYSITKACDVGIESSLIVTHSLSFSEIQPMNHVLFVKVLYFPHFVILN